MVADAVKEAMADSPPLPPKSPAISDRESEHSDSASSTGSAKVFHSAAKLVELSEAEPAEVSYAQLFMQPAGPSSSMNFASAGSIKCLASAAPSLPSIYERILDEKADAPAAQLPAATLPVEASAPASGTPPLAVLDEECSRALELGMPSEQVQQMAVKFKSHIDSHFDDSSNREQAKIMIRGAVRAEVDAHMDGIQMDLASLVQQVKDAQLVASPLLVAS